MNMEIDNSGPATNNGPRNRVQGGIKKQNRRRRGANSGAAPANSNAKSTGNGNATAKPAKKPSVPVNMAQKKLIINGLTSDITEEQIKEYFSRPFERKTPSGQIDNGPATIRSVSLARDRQGVSMGICTIIFAKPYDAQEVSVRYKDASLDNKKKLMFELVMPANMEAEATGLDNRIKRTEMGSQKNGNINNKNNNGNANNNANGKASQQQSVKQAKSGKGKDKARRERRKKPVVVDPAKMQAQLDQGMRDYFADGQPAAAAPVGDAMMD